MSPGLPGRLQFRKYLQRSFLAGMAFVFLVVLSNPIPLKAQGFMPAKSLPDKYRVDRRIDNMGYWKRMVELGLVPVAPARKVPPAVFKSSFITDAMVASPNSPDIPVTELNSSQSENSIFIHPNDHITILNSNNSSENPYPGYFFGADGLFSHDGGESWGGQIQGTGGYNMGDPSTAINSNGRWFVGFIHSGGGQALAYSNDTGTTWKVRAIASPPPVMGGLLDKSHLWIDNSPASPFKGNMYDGWTVFTGPSDGKLQVSRSNDLGLGWQMPVTISDSVHAGSHNQGINIATGPNGEVYATWSIYDRFPGDENAIGFARSLNGGQTWQPATRIIDSIRGIRIHGVNKTMRVNSFPSMAVDNSWSPWRGTIYIVWANVNQPGINSGQGVEVYLIRSSDNGTSWSEPIRINQDPPNTGKQHYFPWIACDPANGNLSVIFYDDRDTPAEQAETWVATSMDGGENWQDFRISDVSFTPFPVTGLSDDYFGDYLGISASNGRVYPVWTDNRTGVANAYVSPFQLGPSPGQAYVVYQSARINDSLSGNANAMVEYNETFFLNLKIRNMGDQPDTALQVILRPVSPFVRMLDSISYLEFLGAGASSPWMSDFQLKIADSVPNLTKLYFLVIVKDIYDSTYLSYFTLEVHAPEVQISDLLVEDTESNNSHSLDPGEQCTMLLRLHNPTAYPATLVNCSFQSLQQYVSIENPPQHLDTIQPFATWDVPFTVAVDSVRAGTLASFRAEVTYSEQMVNRNFNRKIGLIFEDWESGGFRKFDWYNSGDNKWKMDSVQQFDGRFTARSGSIGDNDYSFLEVKSRALTYDSISFYRKVSSEERFDYLKFYIDEDRVGQWSGEQDWERVVFPLLPGLHTFKWEYVKDQGVNTGLDATFIDFIEFPSIQYTTSDAGQDATIYECQLFTCKGEASYYDSLRWVTTGTGTFTDSGNENPVYSPSEADKAAGSVTLILTAFGPTPGEVASDSMNLTILPQPTAFAGPDVTLCHGTAFQLSSASATNYTSLVWSTGGKGNFDDISLLQPLFTPASQDSVTGFVDLILTSYAGNNDACGYISDTMRITFFQSPVIPLEYRYRRCTGYTASLDASIAGGIYYSWKPGGESTPVIIVDSTGVGAGKKVFTVAITDENGCESSKEVEVIFTDCSEKKSAGEAFFRVFPIPAREDLYIELYSASSQKVSYELSNPSGAVVRSRSGFTLSGFILEYISLKGLAQGEYYLTVNGDSGSATNKIIIL